MVKPVHSLWEALEIIGVSVFFFIGLWILGPMIATAKLPPIIFWLIIAAGAIHVFWYSPSKLHHDPPERRGWGDFVADYQGGGSFGKAWRAYVGFTAAAAIMLVVLAGWNDPVSLLSLNWTALIVKLAGYVALGMVQAMFFFGFIQCRVSAMLPVTDGPHAVRFHWLFVVLLTSTIFSLYHLPNYRLMVFTFLAGCCWSWIFYKRPNIVLLGMSHALLGTLLHRVVQLPMRIGPFYDNPDLYILRTVFPCLKRFIGNLF